MTALARRGVVVRTKAVAHGLGPRGVNPAAVVHSHRRPGSVIHRARSRGALCASSSSTCGHGRVLCSTCSDLLARQAGVVTRAQLLEHDVSYPAVRWNAGRAWRVLLPQVFGVFREQAPARQRQIAALLWAGPRGGCPALGGPSRRDAATRSCGVHVLVPAPQRSRTSGFAEVRRTLLHDPHTVTEARCGCRHRLDRRSTPLGRCAPTTPVRPSSSSGPAGHHHGDDLEEWVLRLRPRDAGPFRGPLAEAASGAWSVPESELLDLVATSALVPDWSGQPADRDSRRPTTGSTTSRWPSWCTQGATTARRPSWTTRSTRTETSSPRASSSRGSLPPGAPATRGRARPARAGVPVGPATPSTGVPGDPRHLLPSGHRAARAD